jgi:LysR family transcriptional regulator, nitrogen assimilation regulatory protein
VLRHHVDIQVYPMHLRTLRYFVAVVDAGSLTAAALAIPIAQPALTRQMRELESEMGVQLLQRLPRGVRLTQAGVTFYESAQRMLAEAARLTQKLARSPHTAPATVVLGVPPTLAGLLLPGLFETCMNTLQDVVLRTREAFTPALLEWLERGVIDMAIVTNPDAGRPLLLQPLLAEPFALVSHASMRISPVVQAQQLTRIPLLMQTAHGAGRNRFCRFDPRTGFARPLGHHHAGVGVQRQPPARADRDV